MKLAGAWVLVTLFTFQQILGQKSVAAVHFEDEDIDFRAKEASAEPTSGSSPTKDSKADADRHSKDRGLVWNVLTEVTEAITYWWDSLMGRSMDLEAEIDPGFSF